VLLKNEGHLLPLRKDLTSIAVIGPDADDLQVLLGNYHGPPGAAITPLEGIRAKIAPSTRLAYARGCAIANGVPTLTTIPPAHLRPAHSTAGERGLTAIYYNRPRFAGKPAVRRVDQAVDFIWKDTTPLTGRWGDYFAVRWTGFLVPPKSGRYTLGVNGFSKFSLYLDGKRIVKHDDIHHPIVRTKELDLVAGRSYEIRLDYVNQGLDPQVKLVWSVSGTEDDSTALEVAKEAEIVVMVMGLSPAPEGEEMPVDVEGFSGGDRTDIKLPRPQEKLLRQIHALGKPVVLVLLNGSALAANWAAKHIPAIVEAWYPGQAGGEALADVLFGDYNPAGRLPVTFYRSVENLPPFKDYRMRGRTYRYFKGEPLFPFGYGLSYTTFEYDNLRIVPAEVEDGPEADR
jgi:beta-glucosidase